MNINNTVSSLEIELNKLIQKVENLKNKNRYLATKNKELLEQLNSSSSEQGDASDRLVKFLGRLKNANQENQENQASLEPESTNLQSNDNRLGDNLQRINPKDDFI